MAGDAGTADVDVGRIHVNQLQLFGQLLVLGSAFTGEHAGDVVRVHHSHAAVAPGDGPGQGDVGGEERLAQVGHHAADPGAGGGIPAQDHLAGHQRLVVGALALPQAELALQGRLGQIGVGADRGGIHQLRVDHHGPHTAGQSIPAALGVAQVGGHVPLQGGGTDGLEQALVGGGVEAGGVDEHEHIGGAVLALTLEALQQGVVLGLQQVHLDAGTGGELAIELLVAVVVPTRIDTDAGSGLGDGGTAALGLAEGRQGSTAEYPEQGACEGSGSGGGKPETRKAEPGAGHRDERKGARTL